MHELSIAESLLELVRQHAPCDPVSVVTQVRVRIGPMQAVDADALTLAWDAATRQTPFDHAALAMELLPWQMHCPDCQRQWSGDDPLEPCTCGSMRSSPTGSNELTLVSLEIGDPQMVTRER